MKRKVNFECSIDSELHSGKGVCSQILPDDLMPRLDNGQIVDIVKNQSTCINRENLGQLDEMSLTFIGSRLLDYMTSSLEDGSLTACECFKIWFDFVYMVDPQQANYALTYIDPHNEEECMAFINSIIDDGGIILSDEPFTTAINIDTIRDIYDRFPWIEPYEVTIPIKDSNDNIRYIKTRRRLIAGKIYNYRLKQYAEEKFSVTSLSATNLKNLNTRSKANKVYETKYTKTPIMFGFMESCNMSHLGMQYVVMNLMLYSNSPQARRLFEELLIGSPYDIDIKLDANSKNRNAEIINALFKTMGIRLNFIKKLKEKKFLFKDFLYKPVPNNIWKPKTNILDIIGDKDSLEFRYANSKMGLFSNPLYYNILYKPVDSNGKIITKTNINDILSSYTPEED